VSEENVEIVRHSYEAWNAGREDAGRLTWHDDCEWHDPPDFPDASVFRGPEEVARHLQDLWGAPGIAEVSDHLIEDLIPLPNDEVLVLFSLRVRFSSGVPLELSLGNIVQVSEGKVRRWRAFSSQAAAREAAGVQ
jgi:ketosteroid isomerase-like protein